MINWSIFMIIAGVLLLLFLGGVFDYNYDTNGSWIWFIVISFIVFFNVFVLIYSKIIEQPRSIDVYRNKTTLKIKYDTDSIPQDTIVIWKK